MIGHIDCEICTRIRYAIIFILIAVLIKIPLRELCDIEMKSSCFWFGANNSARYRKFYSVCIFLAH